MFNFTLRNQIMNSKAEIVFVKSWHLKTSGKVVLHVEDVGSHRSKAELLSGVTRR